MNFIQSICIRYRPEKEKITFSIGQPDKHETVEEIVTGEEVKKVV